MDPKNTSNKVVKLLFSYVPTTPIMPTVLFPSVLNQPPVSTLHLYYIVAEIAEFGACSSTNVHASSNLTEEHATRILDVFFHLFEGQLQLIQHCSERHTLSKKVAASLPSISRWSYVKVKFIIGLISILPSIGTARLNMACRPRTAGEHLVKGPKSALRIATNLTVAG